MSLNKSKCKVLIIFLLTLFVLTGCGILNLSQNAPSKKVFKITSVKFYGSLWNSSYNKFGVISQDGGSSFKVPGGAIWAFGDTFKGTRGLDGKPNFKGGGVNCSLAFLPEGSRPYPPKFQFLAGGDGTVVSPFSFLGDETQDKNSIWPLAGIYLNDKYYLYYTVIEKTEKRALGFKHVGNGLSVAEKALDSYKRIIENGTWYFPVNPSAIIETKDWLYLYSVENTSKYVQGVFLARVKPEKLEDYDEYEYYCGEGLFSKNRSEQKVMLREVYGQTSVVWNSYLNKYILVASSSFWEPLLIKFYVSDTPVGPWFNADVEIKIPKIRQNKKVELVYCAFLHPELFSDNGRIMYLTYSLMLKNSGFDANCEMVKIKIDKL